MDTRHEQLRAAKRRQRQRDRTAGQVLYQLKLPAALRERLKAGMRRADFVEKLHEFVCHEVIRIADYPQLALLCWNTHDEYLTREEAFRLYERNWRLVEPAHLDARETALIDTLAGEFGQGVINA